MQKAYSMEQISTLSILMMLSGWIKHSGTTNCTVYLSSPPITLNLLCPSAICSLEMSNMRSCINNCPTCNIADCNKVYSLCNNVSSESSPQEPSRIQHIVSSSKQLVNCTFVVVNTMISVTCQKGDYQLTFKNTTTACTRDLGINCNQDNPVGTCIRTYHFCQPNTCQPLREIVHTTILNQCTKSVTTETHTKEITVTTYSPTLFYTPVQVTVCPSTTSSLLSQTKETVNVTASMASSTNIYHPSTTCSPTSEIHVPTLTVPLTIAAPTTGALVVLLIVVTIGWVCTCRIMKKRGKMEINIMQDRTNTPDDRHTYTQTLRRFDNPLCEEQPCATAPQTTLKPPQQQREEPVYAISLASHRRDHREPTNDQNGPNQARSGGEWSVGGDTQIPHKQGKVEHEYDRLVKVVKQTEVGQGKRDEIVSLERNRKHHISDKQELQYHVQDYLTPTKQESKNFQNRPNKALFPDGGASVVVGMATQFPKTRGEFDHQYDHLVEATKRKGRQNKRDEGGNDTKIDHNYHVLEGPDNDYDDLDDDQERDGVYHILDGPTPVEPALNTFQNRPNKVYTDRGVSVGGATQFPRKQKGCDHQYDHLVKAMKRKAVQNKQDEGFDMEWDHEYHVLEGPAAGNDIDDYDYQDEREGEAVYHVLDGPTPVEEETQFIH